MPSNRLVPVAILGVLAVVYLLVRPVLRGASDLLPILEFPIGIALVGALLVAALRPTTRPAPPPVWRRHRQIVRTMPDPAMAPAALVIERWLASGASPEAVARIVAPDRAPALTPELAGLPTRKRREARLTEILDEEA